MYKHHTKMKGDEGLGFVMADLMSKGVHVALPVSEHLPFDCIAISDSGQMVRLSVKYRGVARNGCLQIDLKSVWSSASGCHVRYYDKREFDAVAVYCPSTRLCYYIGIKEVTGNSFCLRIQAPKQVQSGIRMAEEFIDCHRLFDGREPNVG